MQDPGGVGQIELAGWSNAYVNDGVVKYQSEQLFRSDALLLGRATCDALAAAWPRLAPSFTQRVRPYFLIRVQPSWTMGDELRHLHDRWATVHTHPAPAPGEVWPHWLQE
jgi:hypothetical protein